jgi:hypothetical protein
MKNNGTNWRLEGDYFDGCIARVFVHVFLC